ncbi:hypothetical protein OSB04_002434 [Centaurea solstitialis]|uniref:Uncharacterized protein n=1 Tax=Centaurea solstitialis TaxID=347529 RepID=A0AA38UBC4_9ASTR|nr:hypothetical protein OSB04_002434 [Centaurea solstitialis]
MARPTDHIHRDWTTKNKRFSQIVEFMVQAKDCILKKDIDLRKIKMLHVEERFFRVERLKKLLVVDREEICCCQVLFDVESRKTKIMNVDANCVERQSNHVFIEEQEVSLDDAVDIKMMRYNILDEDIPKVSLEFEIEKQPYNFYNRYAYKIGFSI